MKESNRKEQKNAPARNGGKRPTSSDVPFAPQAATLLFKFKRTR